MNVSRQNIIDGNAAIVASNPQGETITIRIGKPDGPLAIIGARAVFVDFRNKPRYVGAVDIREWQFVKAKKAELVDYAKSYRVAQWALQLIIDEKQPPQGYNLTLSL